MKKRRIKKKNDVILSATKDGVSAINHRGVCLG